MKNCYKLFELWGDSSVWRSSTINSKVLYIISVAVLVLIAGFNGSRAVHDESDQNRFSF